MNAVRLAIVSSLLLLPAAPAAAHPVFAGVTGFYGGLLHPLFVPTHTLALVALGLLIGRQPARARTVAALMLAASLIGGFLAITRAIGETPAPDILLGTAAVCGLLVALAVPLPPIIPWIAAAVTGAALALDSPPDVVDVREAIVMMLGTGLGALLLPLAVVECTVAIKAMWLQIGIRVVGSWIAASAILGLALAGC